ncbi:hypothetical protein NECAME_05419, partial [Necator americanus]
MFFIQSANKSDPMRCSQEDEDIAACNTSCFENLSIQEGQNSTVVENSDTESEGGIALVSLKAAHDDIDSNNFDLLLNSRQDCSGKWSWQIHCLCPDFHIDWFTCKVELKSRQESTTGSNTMPVTSSTPKPLPSSLEEPNAVVLAAKKSPAKRQGKQK